MSTPDLDPWLIEAAQDVAEATSSSLPEALTAVAHVFDAVNNAMDDEDADEFWPQPGDLALLAQSIRNCLDAEERTS